MSVSVSDAKSSLIIGGSTASICGWSGICWGHRFAYDGVGLLPPPLVVRGKGWIAGGVNVSDEFEIGEVEADDEFDDRPTGSSPSG